MALTNTSDDFGAITKTFHWMTALLILTAFPLGMIAERWPMGTEEALAVKVVLFSLHKTVGVMAFLIALGRVAWALGQPKPAPLHPDRRVETLLADTVHWALYASMLLVPLTGWVHHAATTGFAPIWWPFGQSLPFVPVDESVAQVAGAMHWVFTKALLVTVGLHVLGALKHHVVDRDGTLRRMLPGGTGVQRRGTGGRGHGLVPPLAALAIYGLATAGALALVREPEAATKLEAVDAGWAVQEGTLAITVRQMGAEVTGAFESWTAAINFDEDAPGEVLGTVDVTIAIDSLRLGSVTAQAMGADFFDAESHPTARFEAEIFAAGSDYVAEGTLTLKGITLPLALPFTLDLQGDEAVMTARLELDRREFAIGESQQNEATLAYGVMVDIALTATRDPR